MIEIPRTALVAGITFVFTFLLSAGISKQVMRRDEKPCFDTLYVYPLLTDDESTAGGLPARRLTFSCPHPDQKLELQGAGGLTCTCNPFMKRP